MTQSPFNLDHAIASWRQFVVANLPQVSPEQADELELHIRDAFDDFRQQGYSDPEAFQKARSSIGSYDRLESAYQDNFWRQSARRGTLQTEWAARARLTLEHLRLSLRSAKKRPLQTVVNMTGLTVGLTFCLLIGLFVWHQSTYDRFHDGGDRIFRVATDYRIDGEVIRTARSVGPLLPVLNESSSPPEASVRLSLGSVELKRDLIELQSDRILFADSGFFDVFSFPMLRGEPDLSDPLSIILTSSMASRLFGPEDPVGQTITVDDQLEVSIVGVLAPLPDRSHLQFDVLASTRALEMMESWIFTNWYSFYFYTYVKLPADADPAVASEMFTGIARDRADAELIRRDPDYAVTLEPLHDIYLESARISQFGVTGNRDMIRLFSVIGVLILLIADANFVNLATALSVGRAREIGIRKVVGGDRRQLTRQFMAESLLIVGFSSLIALALASQVLPVMNQLTGIHLEASNFRSSVVILVLVSLTLLTALLSGWYPARLMSRIPAAPVLSGQLPGSLSKGQFRKVSVVLQFCICFMLIASTLVVQKQLDFIQQHDNGFRQEGLLSLDFSNDDRLGSNPLLFRERLADIPGVSGVSLSSAVPGDEPLGDWSMDFESREGDMIHVSFPHLLVDEQFLDTYEIPIVAGRDFRDDIGADDTRAVILNESAVRQLGFDQPEDVLGMNYRAYPDGGEVIGVAADFNFRSVREPVGGIAMRYMADRFAHATLRVEPQSIASIRPRLETIWNELNHEKAFNARLLDDVVMQQYEQERHFGRFFRWASSGAIFIALMGLFAQLTLALRSRSKEVGIRRVLGAERPGLTLLLSREVIFLTLLACMAGAPVVWWLLTEWLLSYDVHASVGIRDMILAAGLTVGVALATIVGLTARASSVSPADVLRMD